MFEQLRETVKTDFNTDSDKLFANLTDGNEQVTQDHNKSLMYCDFISGNDSKLFMHVPNVDEVRITAEEQLTEFNLVDNLSMIRNQ